MVKIAGSFLKIQDDKDKIKKLDEVCDLIHFDVMDGQFTERASRPIDKMRDVIKGLRNNFDVHLMVLDLKKYIDEVSLLNPSYITFHLESTCDITNIVSYIHSKGIKAGIAINPETEVSKIYPYLESIDLVLVMSVKAGAGGQKFINITNKIDDLINYRKDNNLDYIIEVDGGINDDTIKFVKNVDIVVAGSFITDSNDYKGQFYKLKKALRNGFTLAELLGVIVVLSILGLIVITSIDKNIKESRYDSCIAQENSLIEGAKMVMIDHPELLPTSLHNSFKISVKELQDGGTINGEIIEPGYIDDDLINPMTDKPYVDSFSGVFVEVKMVNENNFEYNVIYENMDEACHR